MYQRFLNLLDPNSLELLSRTPFLHIILAVVQVVAGLVTVVQMNRSAPPLRLQNAQIANVLHLELSHSKMLLTLQSTSFPVQSYWHLTGVGSDLLAASEISFSVNFITFKQKLSSFTCILFWTCQF